MLVDLASQVVPVVKNLAANAEDSRDSGSIPKLGRSSGEGNGNPLQYSWEKSHGQRNLVGYTPWGHKESDMTERPNTYLRGQVSGVEILGKVTYLGRSRTQACSAMCYILRHGYSSSLSLMRTEF